jgi:hypothetical protein
LNISQENYLLDATDALAIALTHSNQGDKKQDSKGGWDKFLKNNSDRIKQ